MRWFAHAVGLALTVVATIEAKPRQAELNYQVQADEVHDAVPQASSRSLLGLAGRLTSGLMEKLKSRKLGASPDYAEPQNSGLLSKLTSSILGTPQADEHHQGGRQAYGNNGYSWSDDQYGHLNALENIEQMLNHIALPYLNSMGSSASVFLGIIQKAVSYLYTISSTMQLSQNVISPLVSIAARMG
ncbi:hypothetical protein GE061_012794 [Apolygus lucorum]|uniref:Uncharacterized protein n=1 Tax=Apolygus lucorum TaxID=248454 RepID=A0A6A4JIZ4_APOLU|nr:hypothetical protein GE061_012794 [Apolygus lucorum]